MIISKLDAAKRQLEISVKLYFKSEDVVVVHSLLGAAHELLIKLSHQEGKTSLIKDDLLKHIQKDKHKSYFKKINEARNFFKHADNDSDQTIKFNPQQNEILMRDCVLMYKKMCGGYSDIMKAYDYRYMI